MGCELAVAYFPAYAAVVSLCAVHETLHDLPPAPAVRYATSELNLFSCALFTTPYPTARHTRLQH